ncbi:hypothetical protein [Mycobacteroides franklinii]|uniref:hypothetical protein n=1 Tax=Mycobacteroides franklinii TaxID=948102 RepID=UPI00099215FF|nr:hypothetical protein [Mycobacteroides franklinii]
MAKSVGKAAEATTSVAGAIGGAAISGTIGAVAGATAGVRRGLSEGSHSTPAAAAVIGALAVTGLIEWPVVLVVGGAALILRQLNSDSEVAQASTEPSSVIPLARPATKPATSTPTTSAAAKAARPRKAPAKQPARQPRPHS